MNLIVEIGNTNIKLALFEGRELKHLWVGREVDHIWEELKDFKIQNAILSGSGNTDILWWKEIQAEKKLVFTREMLKNIQYEYRTPQSLGTDRLINAWYANLLFQNMDNLVIDTGTCITFTLINNASQLIGGSISPGIALRAHSMHEYTDKLPLIELDKNRAPELIGMDTQASLFSGVILGTQFEIEKRIEAYLSLYPNLNIIMTGGSTQFFENKLNYKIFADYHFTLKGLNEILLTNE
ncbi:MAG: type III pantothenate kinase [Chitinophagales bacterium]|nr:type III pantothenate kinase [Chitinophagales bacterium]